jgi:Spy/CpxP family protein refolding chaperone
MKKIIAIVLAAMMLTSVAFAANSTPTTPTPHAGPGQSGQPGPNFAAHKQKILSSIAQRIQRLQAVQSCVQSAQNHEAIKACREQSRGNSGGQE